MASQKGLLAFFTLPILTTAGLATLSREGDLRLIEVHFLDNSDDEEKIKISITDLSQLNKAKIWKKVTTANPAQVSNTLPILSSATQINTTKTEGKWEPIDKSQPKYLKLYDIAKQYLETQHSLNIIRSYSWSLAQKDDSLKNEYLKIEACKTGKCCCNTTTGTTCQDSCSTCLCFYADDQQKNTQPCCCKNGNGSCKFNEFKKIQSSFSYYFQNNTSPELNKYLSPVQIHIKLDAKFSELNESSGDTTYKSFFGSTVYGFVNYQYKEESTPTNTSKLSSNTDLITFDENDKKYFVNIPNKFQFTVKTTTTKGSSTNPEPVDHISKIRQKTEEKPERIRKIEWLSKNSSVDECCCCPTTNKVDDYFLNCTLKKNLMFMVGKDKLSDIANKLKQAKTSCCVSSN